MLAVSTLASIAAALALLVAAARHIQSCLALPNTAGPPWARWSRLWYLRATWKGDFHEWNMRAHARGGTYAAASPAASRIPSR